MAVYYARSSGNVNGTIWATTPSGTASNLFGSFTNQDVLMSNNFTVTLNVNTTVLEIRNDNSNSATGGGGFVLSGGVTLTANIVGGSSTATLLAYSAAGTASIVGQVTAAAGSAINFSGSGTLNITGNITGGTTQGAHCVLVIGNGVLNVVGNVIGSSTVQNTGGIYIQAASATVTISGTVTGGSASQSNAIQLASAGTINIIGVVVPGLAAPGVANLGTGTITITRARGNGFGPGSTGLNNIVAVAGNQNGRTRIYELEYGALGNSPTSGPIEIIDDSTNVAIFAVRNSSSRTLVDLNNAPNLIPSSGNVRSGVSYNYGNNVGSCVIPNANSVVYGVRVDNTIGSGLLSPAAVWNYLTTSISTSGSIGERLKNASTVATVGKQLEGAL